MTERYCYDYPRPAVVCDIVVFARIDDAWNVLLIRRRHDPAAGSWALPGGFVEIDEELHDAAARELEEETGVRGVALEQLGAYGRVDRDPRGRTIAVAYSCIVDATAVTPRAGDDAADVAWHPLADLPPLAFDHADMITAAERRLPERA